MNNPAKEYVHANASNSPIHQFVAEHGQAISDSERTSIAGYQVSISEEITSTERSLIGAAIQSSKPSMKECFANALRMWEFDHRFKYAEGFAVPSAATDKAIEHAWVMLDGDKLVDLSPQFNYHYGVVITSDNILEQYTGSNFSPHGIIGNHRNRYKFLRERGYMD